MRDPITTIGLNINCAFNGDWKTAIVLVGGGGLESEFSVHLWSEASA